MSWYQTPAVSFSWGFWQVNRATIPEQYWHYPDKKTSAGSPDIASVYCPAIGPYNSGDPDLCEYHILLAKLCGIDIATAEALLK
jgi:glycoprotein endo-alpha-1,2-mannosidase